MRRGARWLWRRLRPHSAHIAAVQGPADQRPYGIPIATLGPEAHPMKITLEPMLSAAAIKADAKRTYLSQRLANLLGGAKKGVSR